MLDLGCQLGGRPRPVDRAASPGAHMSLAVSDARWTEKPPLPDFGPPADPLDAEILLDDSAPAEVDRIGRCGMGEDPGRVRTSTRRG